MMEHKTSIIDLSSQDIRILCLKDDIKCDLAHLSHNWHISGSEVLVSWAHLNITE